MGRFLEIRRVAAAAATALVCAALAAAAGAQVSTDDLPSLPSEATDALRTATEPAPYLKDQTDQDVDTDYTPIAKESKFFSLHQGASYRSEGEGGAETEALYEARRVGSQNSAGEQVTTWDDELTDVAFSNTRNGFAGGQRKLDCKAADGNPGTDGVPDTYVPAIYRYGDSPTGLRWLRGTEEKGGLLGDCSNPGFVGAIAWIRTTGMAIAVGGDGSYPYRAPAYGKDVNGGDCAPDPTKPFGANCDQAGLGRAWLFNHGRWQELDYDAKTFPNDPLGKNELGEDEGWGDTLHGMTALDCSPSPDRDFCFAGALGQLWPLLVEVKGQNGPCEASDANDCLGFPADGVMPGLFQGSAAAGNLAPAVGKFDMDSRSGPDGAPEFVVPPPENAPSDPDPRKDPAWQAWTVEAQRRPTRGDLDDAFRFRFRVRQIRMDNGKSGSFASQVGAAAVTDGCCAGDPEAAAEGGGAPLGPAGNYPSLLMFDGYGETQFRGTGGWRWKLWSADLYAQRYEHAAYYGLPEAQRRALPPPNPRPDWPDSFYSVGFAYGPSAGGPMSRVSLVAAPGGPPPGAGAPERPSLVSEPICFQSDHASSGQSGWTVSWVDLLWPFGQGYAALRAQLASVRLLDGDGDELSAFAFSNGSAAFPLTVGAASPPFAGAPSNAQRGTGIGCSQGLETRRPDAGVRDAVPDWAVGELGSTHAPGLGARGLAFSTVSRPTLVPEVLDLGWTGDEESLAAGLPAPDPARVLATLADPVNHPPTRQEKLVAYLQSQHFFTGSYALGAIDYLDGFGSGWAVGKHGGIVQLGGGDQDLATKAKVEPEPPPLGAKRPGQVPERTPYEAFDPPSAPPGAVPPLGPRPAQRLAERVLRFTGAPNASGDYADRDNELGQLVLSRDGAEGWGLDRAVSASGSRAMTLFHLQGGAWSRCDPEGIDGVMTPDPACSALAPLRAYSINGKLLGVVVAAAARIPYENDSDASNDDEFEVLAFGTGYRTPEQAAAAQSNAKAPPALMRYREGAWRIEDDPELQVFLGNLGYQSPSFYSDLSMAFATPEDGWALSGRTGSSAQPTHSLIHFDGERWVDCTTSIAGDPKATSTTKDSKGQAGTVGDRAEWCEDPELLTISADEDPSPGGSRRAQDVDTFAGLVTAGKRLYLYGSRQVQGQSYPLLLCKDAGEDWRSAGCGLDPGFAVREGATSTGMTGEVTALSVAVGQDGVPRGWATGRFDSGAATDASTTSLLRLTESGWAPYDDEGPLRDVGVGSSPQLIALPDGGGLIGGVYRFESDIGRWRAFPGSANASLAVTDGNGGAWLASGNDLVHYTDHPPKPVFDEAPTPLPRKQEILTALAGQPSGNLWATTSDGNLYRYARSTGWDRVPIPGWRAERAIVSSAAYAVAVNDSGVGVAVGHEGRIADLAGSEVRLDAAAGTLCDLTAVVPPCGSSRHLRAAAVAPDGAAIVGGEHLALLWRPPGGHFRAIERPEAATSAKITGLSLPSAEIAYATTGEGQLFRGERRDRCGPSEPLAVTGKWCWRLESTDAADNLLTRDPTSIRKPVALHAVAVDAAGHGYAVGERGVILERSNEGAHPWRLLRSGVSYDLISVALRDEHALVGGTHGLVLTGSGERFEVARAADRNGVFDGFTGAVVGLALSGGVEQAQTEAWAATDATTTGRALNLSQLFHYASDGSEPLLDPGRTAAGPLADSPAARREELSFAALGKLDCHREHALCPDPGDVNDDYLALARRSIEAVAARSRQPNGPALTVFTGDLVDDAGVSGAATVNLVTRRVSAAEVPFVEDRLERDLSGAAKLRAHRTWLAEPLARAGLPLYAAIGSQDLATSQYCTGGCLPTSELARAGLTDAWRTAFADEPAPWGRGKRFATERYETRPLASSGSSLTLPDPELDAAGTPVEVKLVSGGARTHYAFDLTERETGKKLARFVVADNSLRSLAASDPLQHPTEAEANEGGSGQAGWLRRVLCTKGSGSRCSRDPGQPAIVVANAPTYSYASPDQRFWAKDAAVFESLLFQNKATAVVSGSLGWNGRYWATAPGLHVPCQGEDYQDAPPAPGEASCRGRSSSELPLGAGGVAPVANQLASALGPAGPALDEASSGVNSVAGEGLLPFVVASGAGGKLQGQGASDGFFHGYTIVRVPGDANPAGVLVEQRPLFDFLQVTAASHVLRPGQKMTLKGVGRGPAVFDSSIINGSPQTASFEPIDSAAIGHRYDLVEADPQKPWLPKDPYVPLDPSVATVDPETGAIAVGRGNNPRTFALGLLSVGCSGTQAGADGTCDPGDPGVKVATFPLVFESRRTFKSPPPPPPPVAQLRAQAQAALPQPPNPPQPPAVKNAPLPSPPNVPVPPAPQVPEVNAPVPPIPPPPPVSQSPVPLDLSASAPSVTIAPQTTVIPPPAPPIQPAPPGGARREARQRQSATQSSGSGSGSESQHLGGDLADGPPKDQGAAMTRVDRARADGGSMTAYYGASVTLLAIVAAFGWNYGRPGPRRRPPTVAAPAWARNNRRR